MFQRLCQFRIRTLLVAVFVAALFARCVLVPEIQRTATFERLETEDIHIGAPWVTLFSGGPPNQDPMPKPYWFGTRQKLASLCGIKTIPWRSEGTLDFPFEKIRHWKSFVDSQEDLANLLLTSRKYVESTDGDLIPMPAGYYSFWVDRDEVNP